MLDFIISEIPERNASTNDDFSAYVPESWSCFKMHTKVIQHTLFSYTIMKINNGEHCPITQKCVTIDVDGVLKYFVYGRHVDSQHKLEQFLKKKEMLSGVLEKFQEMKVCSGLSDVNIHFIPAGEAYQDYVDKWRSKGCSLLSIKKRCDSCMKLRKCILQRATRLKNHPTMKRIDDISNPVRCKLSAMRIKIRRERRQKLQAKYRVKHLMTCMKTQKAQIASMQDAFLNKKCAELNVPESQKLALKEIIAAASKKDTRGRRYTEEWVMLCMLMNIRSVGYYEFMRKNNILPLPCTRTIRSYFSLINAKCGFDEHFAKLLEKHFASKAPLQRHGVLLLDEINLRKSVTVSKNLTYVGLTDLGDDGQQSTDINEQATHGLVLMFQPLADVSYIHSRLQCSLQKIL